MDEDEEFERRKGLTFLQAEGLEPLPQQLKRGEVSQKFRSKLLLIMHRYLTATSSGNLYNYKDAERPFEDEWVNRRHNPVDEFGEGNRFDRLVIYHDIKELILKENDEKLLDFVQFIMRSAFTDSRVKKIVGNLFSECHMAYRVFGNPPTLIPVSSKEDANTILQSLKTLSEANQKGASAHLKNAAVHLNAGDFSDSVRESINAVESTVRKVTGKDKATLTDALILIENATHLHKSLKSAFGKLYGYTSDEKGIRHASINGDEMVDEHLALFMFSTCASFCAYLVNITRK
jgi:hypothetical protein